MPMKLSSQRLLIYSRILKYWKNIKVTEETLQVDRISFDMTISNIKDSIKWHKALINEYDEYVESGKKQELMIKNINFGEVEDTNENVVSDNKIEELKEIILNNPEKSKEALDCLMKIMSQK